VLLPALYLKHVRHIPLIMDWGDWFGRSGAVEERPNALWRTVLRPVETFLEERFRKQADGTLVICEALYRRAVGLGVSPETILKLPSGADVDSLRPPEMLTSRRTLNLPADILLIGYLGAIFQRDAQLMAQAFDLIHATQPRSRLLLVGYVNAPVEQMMKAPSLLSARESWTMFSSVHISLRVIYVGCPTAIPVQTRDADPSNSTIIWQLVAPLWRPPWVMWPK
jgi:hypothetical protein